MENKNEITQKYYDYVSSFGKFTEEEKAYGLNFLIGKNENSKTFGLNDFLSTICNNPKEFTDLKLEAGKKIWMKIDGKFKSLSGDKYLKKIDNTNLELLVGAILIMTSEKSDKDLNDFISGETDFDKAINFFDENTGKTARFRISISKSVLGRSLIFRFINPEIPNIEKLNLPNVVYDTLKRGNGMILVTGPPGSGKSTTLESILKHLLDTRPVNILSLEDPIEHIFEDNIGTITQREIGSNVNSFKQGAKTALRQSINVLYLTELREAEVIKIALQASQYNIMVLASIHADSIANTTERILNDFPVSEQGNMAKNLASQITLMLNQRLVVCKKIKELKQTNEGFIPIYEEEEINGKKIPIVYKKAVYETISTSSKIRDAIRKQDLGIMMDSLYDEVRSDSKGEKGITLLDKELVKLFLGGEITIDEAIKNTYDKENLKRELDSSGVNVNDEMFYKYFKDVISL